MSHVLPPRSLLRCLAAAGLAGALVLVPVATASAHVRVHPDTTAAGSTAELTFRVPDESAAAGTTALTVTLPTTTPLTSVLVKTMPGWTVSVTDADLPKAVDVGGARITNAPARVTWTAEPGTQISPGQFDEFAISAGPLPKAGTTLVLPAAQTYSDGTVVEWDEKTPASGAEPDHPAPELITTAADAGSMGGMGSAPSAAAAGASRPVQNTTTHVPTGLWWLSGAGVLVAVVALVLSLVSLVRARRAPTPGGGT